MTLELYEKILKEVEERWDTYNDTFKWWTRQRLIELAREIK